ncbi:MAG: hypothetical protein GX804_02880 [Lentisphaerae bacterium]|jgi:hypothetical protein|nr:hypothetical protein [Lentisphaerota bacterium]
MKLNTAFTIVLIILSRQYACAQDTNMICRVDSALPLQAAVCDIAGIGHAVEQDEKYVTVQIDHFWFGSVTNNPVRLYREYAEPLPTNGIPVIFFASKYQSFLSLEPTESRFSYIFDMDYHRSRHEPDGVYFLNIDSSWFPATPENAAITTWCSNLVYVSQVNTNRQAFYELIRDGYRLNPPSSRIHRDSEYAFQYFHYYNDTNFMRQVWSDTNLVGWARGWIKNRYWLETRTWLD